MLSAEGIGHRPTMNQGNTMSENIETNDQLILIGGVSGAGKSAALRNIRNQERWWYMNTEAGKRLPFRNNFKSFRISDPYQIWEGFDAATGKDDVDGIIVDSLTFMLDMFETMYIRTATNGQQAWGNFSDFVKVLLQQKVVLFGKPVIFTAHILDVYDESSLTMKTAVPVKGSLKNNGIEAYFSTVVEATKVPLKDLEKYGSELLNVDEDDEILGFKHVFQTRITAATTGRRIRSPMGLFSKEQTYVDNDAQLLLDHLGAFYGS
jgi:hypothetical protein